MKKNKLFLSVILILLSAIVKAQVCNFKTESIYYINISGSLDNGRPVFTQLIIKNIDTLKYYIQNGQSDFLCNILKSAIFVTEPYLGFLDMNKCLGENAEMEFASFNKKLASFNKKCKPVVSFPNNEYKYLHLSVVKTTSEFWVLPFNINQINNTSEAIQLQAECYNSQYYYKFKKIIKVIPLSRKEIKSFDKLR